MRLLSSLQGRIFLASALLATVSIGSAVYFVSARLTTAAEAELQRDLTEAANLVDQRRELLFERHALMARLIADLPRLKAALGTRDVPTVQPVTLEYQQQVGSDVFVVADPNGQVLGDASRLSQTPALPQPGSADPFMVSSPLFTTLQQHSSGLLQLIRVPIAIGLDRPELLGTLTVGYLLDSRRAQQFKAVTGADVAFAVDGQVLASTLGSLLTNPTNGPRPPVKAGRVTFSGTDYELLVRRLAPLPGTAPTDRDVSNAAVLILASRTERMQPLAGIQRALAALGLVTVLLAVGVSYAVARTVTRPLATITNHMRQVAATGDVTRKLALRSRNRWDDDDARVLASAFNALTETIAQSERRATLRERLSSLGHMSTIMAHEIRNPLMIIKGALRQLTRERATRSDVRDAAADIDGEITRLNRLVNGVLDFARPITFDCAPTDVNAICRAAAAATIEVERAPAVTLHLDPALSPLFTDGERLRTVLVNLLSNARQAVHGKKVHGAAPQTQESLDPRLDTHVVALRTVTRAGGGVIITVSDHGIGIGADDLPRIFEPFYTTRSNGTGLGLAIAKNIIEGLGGTIEVSSSASVGTDIRVELGNARL